MDEKYLAAICVCLACAGFMVGYGYSLASHNPIEIGHASYQAGYSSGAYDEAVNLCANNNTIQFYACVNSQKQYWGTNYTHPGDAGV